MQQIIVMNSKKKRVDSLMKQLYSIHEELFGQKYSIGLTIDESSEFNRVVDEFREVIFTIKSSQEERDRQEMKRNFFHTPDKVRINHEIREDIVRAQGILQEAARRMSSGSNDPIVLKNREKILSNCYTLLKDVKEVEEGGVYYPPEVPTLQQIKQDLLKDRYGNEEAEECFNVDEEIAMGQFDLKDKKMDDKLQEFIGVNANVRNGMVRANQAIDVTREQIEKAKNKADSLQTRVEKADKDLAEILKTYQRPSQLCLNITLILMILALIAVIIDLVRGKTV